MQQSKLATWWLSKSTFPLKYLPQFHLQSLQWQKGITPLLLHITHVDTVQLPTFPHISYEKRLSQHYMLISAGTCKSKLSSTQHYRNNSLAIFHFPVFVDEQREKKEVTLWSSAAAECGHGVCWKQKKVGWSCSTWQPFGLLPYHLGEWMLWWTSWVWEKHQKRSEG